MHEVVVLTGFSKYMLDYLVREAIFVPSIDTRRSRGVTRRYAYNDVVLLRALKAICAGKGKIRHLRESLNRFRADFGPLRPGQRIDKRLFVDGDELCAYTPAQGGRQLRSGQMTFAFVADLSAITSEIAECIVVDAKPGHFSLTPAVEREAEQEKRRMWEPIKARRRAAARRRA